MFKQIRKAARAMRPEIAEQQVGRIATGKELLAQGINEVEGKPVKEKETYKGKGIHQVPVNHYRKMKAAYVRGGVNETVAYMDASYDRTDPAS